MRFLSISGMIWLRYDWRLIMLTASDGQGYLLRIVQQLTYAVLFDLLGESMLCRLTELFSRDVFWQREKEESKTLFGVTLPLAHIIDAAVRFDEAETMRACARAVCALLRSDGDIDLDAETMERAEKGLAPGRTC